MYQVKHYDSSGGAAAFLEYCAPSLPSLVAEAAAVDDDSVGAAVPPYEQPPCAVLHADSLSAEAKADTTRTALLVTNPPFGGATGSESDARDDKKTAKTELLFVHSALERVAPGGRACVLVPPGLLFGSSKQHLQLRRMLIELHRLEAVISLPGGVFRPHSGVASALLVFRRGCGPTSRVWLANVRDVGYSLDGKRRPTDANDLPVILRRWLARDAEPQDRASQAFYVPVEELRGQDYNLNFGRHQELTFEKPEDSPPLEELMRDILVSGRDADRHMIGLAAMIGMDLGDLVREGVIDRIPPDLDVPYRLSRPSDGSGGTNEGDGGGGGQWEALPAPGIYARIAAEGAAAPSVLRVSQEKNGLRVSALDAQGRAFAEVLLDLSGGRLELSAWDRDAAAAGGSPSTTALLSPELPEAGNDQAPTDAQQE
jgi:hypothetical protein